MLNWNWKTGLTLASLADIKIIYEGGQLNTG